FHVIATEGSLARASKVLGITQPTLSAQLKQLEEHFGTRLFDRSGGSLRINSNGRRIQEITHEMFRVGERLDGIFPGNQPRILSRLEIGISTTVARSFAMDRFNALFADREILTRVRLGDHEYLHHELLTSGLDLMITDRPPERRGGRGTAHRQLSSPEFVVICPAGEAYKHEGQLPHSLNRQPFIHYTSHSAYRFEVDQWVKETGVELEIVAEADDVYLIREAVVSGVGLGVVPKRLVDEATAAKVKILCSLPRTFEIHAVYMRKDPSAQVLKALDLLADPAD
ncbi:MAG: LysR family transcriptional regulator, partial [Verrucomicrobiaceae bacterium]